MKSLRRIIIITVALFSLCAVNVFAADDDQQQSRGRRQGPPPEAYSACEGKSAGDSAEFVSPHGDTVTGVCEMVGDRLVLRPDNPPPDGGRGGRNNDE